MKSRRWTPCPRCWGSRSLVAPAPEYHERALTSQDGLKLFYRDYDGFQGNAIPVLCLPGVTRNSKDFAYLALRLAGDRRVLCPDLRGRGRSDYDAAWENYNPAVYINDIRHLLASCGIHRVHVIGTSLGGILAMVMAVSMPGVIASAVLNDIGPDVEPDGLAHIIDYMRDVAPLSSWDDVAGHIRAAFPDLPARTEEDWVAIAKNTYRETLDGMKVQDWDKTIVKQLAAALPEKTDLWPLFKALGKVPVLAVRGAKSSILSAFTLDAMHGAMPSMKSVIVDDCGHPPSLSEPHVLEAIDEHLDRV